MKKLFLTLLLLNSLASFGQFTRGDKYLGGYFNFSTRRTPDSNGGLTKVYNNFGITPTMGFFLNERLAIGGQLGYSIDYNKFGASSSDYTKTTTQHINPGFFVRSYYKITDKFYFTIIGNINFDRQEDKSTYINNNSNYFSESKTASYDLSANVVPNFVFFPSRNWAIDLSIGSVGYTFTKTLNSPYKSNYFNINYGYNSLGVFYYFRSAN